MSSSNNSPNGFLTTREMKRNPIFKDIFVETGHPEHAVNAVTEQLEDMGFHITSGGSSISQDDVAEGVKTYLENIEARRTEEEYRKNAQEYKTYFWIALGISVLFTLIGFAEGGFFFIAIVGWAATFILKWLSNPLVKKDSIWIKVKGKIYSGTKARELRETGKNKAGVTKTASTVYVHSEITFLISGDSEIDVKRVREDINTLSKHIQKL